MWPFEKQPKKNTDKDPEVTLTIKYRSGRVTNHFAKGNDPSVFDDVKNWWDSPEQNFVFTFASGEFFCVRRDDIETMYVNK